MTDRPVVSFTRADAIEFKATDWLIDGWLVKDTLAALIAPSGACKSFLAIDWSCRVATGLPWFNRDVEQGAVFYLAGEGRQGLRKRICAWESFNKQKIDGAPLYMGFYPVDADTSKKAHDGPKGVSCPSEEHSTRISSVRPSS